MLKVSSNPKSKLQGSQQEGFFSSSCHRGRCDTKLLSTPADFQLALRQETSPLPGLPRLACRVTQSDPEARHHPSIHPADNEETGPSFVPICNAKVRAAQRVE